MCVAITKLLARHLVKNDTKAKINYSATKNTGR